MNVNIYLFGIIPEVLQIFKLASLKIIEMKVTAELNVFGSILQ